MKAKLEAMRKTVNEMFGQIDEGSSPFSDRQAVEALRQINDALDLLEERSLAVE